jgi:hypothetical protein
VLVYPGCGWEVPHGAHLFVLLNDSWAGLEPATAVAAVVMVVVAEVRNGPKFSQCNMLSGSFPLARDSGF